MKKNYINLIMFIIIYFVLTGFAFTDTIENDNKPSKGEYQFPMELEWSKAGPDKNEFFGLVVKIVVSDSGNVFLRDMKNKKYYAFDKNGKFIKNFGEKGEGPGEVKNITSADLYVFKNIVIIKDSDKILYFDDKANFIRSIRHLGSISLFINENEIITAPQNILGLANDKAKMKYINLKTNKEKIIADFTVLKSGALNTGNIRARATIPTITPVMLIGLHKNRIYYGMNNEYKIHINDLSGKAYNSFKLEAKVKNVSKKEKEDFMINLSKGVAPKEVAIQIAKTFPDKETYFQNIVSQDNMLYIYRTHFIPVNYQQIDIFNTKGKYLYKGFVKIDKDNNILAVPVFKKEYLYLAQIDEEGEIVVGKYKTRLPK